MDIQRAVVQLIDEVLSLNGRSRGFTAETPLLGAIPELDSMAVVTLISALEERFDIHAEDDEIDGALFATVGSLVDFVSGKCRAGLSHA